MTNGSHRASKKEVSGQRIKGGNRRAVRPHRRIKIAATLILLVAFIAGSSVAAYAVLLPPVVGKAQEAFAYDEDASAICDPFELNEVSCTVERVISDEPFGKLVRQEPTAGQRSKTVTLFYSKGASSIKMPILAGLTQDEARKVLLEKGLTVGEISEENSATPKGVIISSSIEPATAVGNGQAIPITISNGKLSIPNWTGETRELVETEAANAGIKVKFTEKLDDKQAPGLVIAQSVSAKDVANDTTVEITLSKKAKAKDVAIPDIIGETQSSAISILASQGFTKIKAEYRDVASKGDNVVEVRPGQGKKVPVTTEVVLVVERAS